MVKGSLNSPQIFLLAGSHPCLNLFFEWAEPSIASRPLPAAVMKPAARM